MPLALLFIDVLPSLFPRQMFRLTLFFSILAILRLFLILFDSLRCIWSFAGVSEIPGEGVANSVSKRLPRVFLPGPGRREKEKEKMEGFVKKNEN